MKKDYKERNNFTLRTTFSYSSFSGKMCLKSAAQKLNFVMSKAISKSYTLDCCYNALARSRIVTHGNAAFFLIKTILCETKQHFLVRTIENYTKGMLDSERTFK